MYPRASAGTQIVLFLPLNVGRVVVLNDPPARRGGDASGGALSSPGKVIVSDINPWMLGEGEKRASKMGLVELQEETEKQLAGLEFVEGNAEHLPFEDGSVDVYTIAFGLRNVTDTLAVGPGRCCSPRQMT